MDRTNADDSELPFSDPLAHVVDKRDRGALLRDLLVAKGEIEERDEALRLVYELGLRLQRGPDLPSIAAETVKALTGYRVRPLAVFFHLLDSPEGPLRLMAGHGLEERDLKLGALLPLEGSANGLAVREQRIVKVPDVRKEAADLHPSETGSFDRLSTSTIHIPLTHAGTPLGTVSLLFPEGHRFQPVEVEALLGISRTVSLALSNAQQIADLESRAFHDPLTGLPNRAGLHHRLGPATPGLAGQERVGLVLVDLHRFREINDTLGHDVGDSLLVHVAERLAKRGDGQPGDVFRLGGDAFAVLVPGAETIADVADAARRLLDLIAHPVKVAGTGLEVRASAGVALFPDHARDSHTLLRCADVALSRAKAASGSVAAYTLSMDEQTPRRLAILSELGTAIREGELVLHFQPKVALQSGLIEGFEALVRWRHPRLGLLSSGQFIPFTEPTETIQLLTRWVVKSALEQLTRWNRHLPSLTMAINLSMRNVHDPHCMESLAETIRTVGVDPGVVEFELTETAIMTDPERAVTALERITAGGTRLAMDDFGTGYASLAYLKRLPVHTIKIDQSFVADMTSAPRSRAIVHSTVQLAHSLEIGVVAEGIENLESARALREMACDLGQGYYFARPEPADDATRHIKNGGRLDVPF